MLTPGVMKTSGWLLAVTLFLVLSAGCYRRDADRRDDNRTTPGEAAGKAAYTIQQGAKKAAKEIGKDLKTFGHDARQGFQEQKQKDLERKKAREAEDTK